MEGIVHPSFEGAILDIPVDKSVPNVPNAKAWGEQKVELRAFFEKRLREATATLYQYANRRTKP
jgi:hypothetical protein